MEYKILSLVGLFLDIAGVVMLFRYGLPSKVLASPTLELMKGLSEDDTVFSRKIKRWSYTGLSVLIVGFTCQFIAVCIQ